MNPSIYSARNNEQKFILSESVPQDCDLTLQSEKRLTHLSVVYHLFIPCSEIFLSVMMTLLFSLFEINDYTFGCLAHRMNEISRELIKASQVGAVRSVR